MKIIQSFWSKPLMNPYANTMDSRAMGGFPSRKYFIYTWALSILRLREHFDEVHLVTDDFGKELLINALKLPYTSYSIELNILENMPSQFWCAGKLHVFANTDCPFLHLDGDVILGDSFDKKLLNQALIAEFHYEDKAKNYEPILHFLKNNQSGYTLPKDLQAIINEPNFIYNDYNHGIIGGNDVTFLNDFGKKAQAILAENKDKILSNDMPISFLNCLTDQFNFYCMTQATNKKVTLCIKEKFDTSYDYQAEILGKVTTDFSFVHFHSNYKAAYYEVPEQWLACYYPKEYRDINRVLFGA